MTWGNVAAGVASVAGAYLGSKDSDEVEQAEFTPFNVDAGIGHTEFDLANRHVFSQLHPNFQTGLDLASQGAVFDLRNPEVSSLVNASTHLANQGLVPAAQDALSLDSFQPSLDRFDASLQGLRRGTAGLTNRINPLFNQLGDQAQGLIDGPGFMGIANQRLNLMRQQAAPFEERAFNANNQNLFSTGRLGTTGGGLQTEAFARGLGQADLQRQVESMNFADTLRGQDRQLGTSLLGLQQGIAGLGFQGFNQLRDLDNLRFQGNLTGIGAENQRGQQRLANIQNLFGFGQTAQQNQLALAQSGFDIGRNFQSDMLNQIALGANIGGAQTQAFGTTVPGGGPSLFNQIAGGALQGGATALGGLVERFVNRGSGGGSSQPPVLRTA